jgi:transcriptional regulator with GAF, ATPase, and Fis domain
MDGVIGRSRPMQQLFEVIDTIAPTTSTVLITGETGTGKEVVARAIHQRSARRAQPFVALNCAAMPETLLEAELFGHVRGAFTGAVAQRQGRFEQAHRGTLFLDEVGTMSAALQAKLLRALQEREFERVGESRTTRVDVRVIGATHSDLQQMVRDGLFREDLFYRLNVIPLQLPPLRERREDIPLLVQHFLQRGGAETTPPLAVAQEAMRALMDYPWPGNVRQLENAIERAVAFGRARGRIERSDLPPDVAAAPQQTGLLSVPLPDDGLDFEATVDAIARDLIVRALERTGGHKGQAATLLGLKRTTLVEKLKRLQLPEPS